MVDLSSLPEHPRSYSRRDGYIYILQASTGILKAGKTRNPRGRIGTHHRDAVKFGATIDHLWLSPMHENYSENETTLLASLGTPEHGNEYFRVDFATAVSAAEKLNYIILSEDQRSERDARLDAEVKERLSWLTGYPRLPDDYVMVRVPKESAGILATLFSPELPSGFSREEVGQDLAELISEMSLKSGIPVGEIGSWSYLQVIEYLAKLAVENRRLDLTLRARDEGRMDLVEPAYELGPDRPSGAIYPQDALKYASALLTERTDWALDSIGGSMCDRDGHEIETDALHDIAVDIASLAAQFGDPNVYSDGRFVKTGAWIDGESIRTERVWHPDPTQDESESWRGDLLHDPGTPCPGLYEVSTDPMTQQIHVRVMRSA